MKVASKDIETGLFIFFMSALILLLAMAMAQAINMDMRDQLHIYDSSPVVHPEKHEAIRL